MEYGININFFSKTVGLVKAAQMIAQAGFTMLDYTPPLREDNWETSMKEAAKVFDSLGLTVHQTHAPFNRYGSCGEMHAVCLERCAQATAQLGAKYMVVHGDEFDFEHMTFTPEAALDYNYRMFRPYVERCGREGYQVAFETVFEDGDRRRFTSQAQELEDLIASFAHEDAVCCWDFGHGNVSFRREAPQRIREFGKLIRCTHLHDNSGIDAHQVPMTGDIDWKETMEAFREIGYAGVMSVEYAHGSMPELLIGDLLRLTYRTTAYLWN